MAITPEDVCNQALRRIGYPTPIGTMYEGSPASRVAVDVFAQTRDELLRIRDWDFSRQTVSLGIPLKTAPPGGYTLTTPWSTAYPPLPWIYEYPYPVDCLEVKSLCPQPGIIPEQLPRWVLFEKANDSATGQPVILTNLSGAFASITGAVYDPAAWTDPGFVEALLTMLATIFQRAFPGKDGVNAEVLSDRIAGQAGEAGNARQG